MSLVIDCPGTYEEALPVGMVETADKTGRTEASTERVAIPSHREPPASMPPLPEEARLDDSLLHENRSTPRWVDQYVRYACSASPRTPELFHESAALMLGATAIARRLNVVVSSITFYPNLYILWIALSTLFAKSTGITVAKGLADEVMPHLLLPDEWTPEALQRDAAGLQPTNYKDLSPPQQVLWSKGRDFAAQRSVIRDEFSGLLNSRRKDYNEGLTEILLYWYDCPGHWERTTVTHGLTGVSHLYLSLLAATTPKAVQEYLRGPDDWDTGFWPRFALLYEEDKPAYVPPGPSVSVPSYVKDQLNSLANTYLPGPQSPDPPQSTLVPLRADAHRAWEQYSKALAYTLLEPPLPETLYASYGRFPAMALKVALIVAATDWDGEAPLEIGLPEYARAQVIVERWRQSLHRLWDSLQEGESASVRDKILLAVANEGGVITRSRLTNRMGRRQPQRQQWEPQLQKLLDGGLVRDERAGSTEYYKLKHSR